jgi:hypothetical protein
LMDKMDNQINIALESFSQDNRDEWLLGIEEGLRSLLGTPVIFTRHRKDTKPLLGWPGAWGPEPVDFGPSGEVVRLAAVDSSCRRVAETREGTVYAVRGALVEAEGGRFVGFRRFGPLLYHLTPSTCERLVGRTPYSRSLSKLIQVEPAIAESFLRRRMERLIQHEAVEGGVGLLLVDGSLRASRFDDAGLDLRSLVEKAERMGASVVGISKTTRLKVLTRCIGRISLHGRAPSLVDVKDEMGIFGENLVGHPYIVRFSLYGDPLRVDVASRLDATRVLGSLLANDQISAGYPESLRLAHHLSVLRDADIACIEGFMVGRLGVEPYPALDARLPFLQDLPGAIRH